MIYSKFNRHFSPREYGASLTIPNQAPTLRQIIGSLSTPNPLRVKLKTYYSDDDVIPSIRISDISVSDLEAIDNLANVGTDVPTPDLSTETPVVDTITSTPAGAADAAQEGGAAV